MTFQIDADLLGNPRRALAPREDGHRSPGSQGRLATAAGPPHSAAFTVPARASTLLSAQAGLSRTGVAAVARGPIILICEPGCVGSSTNEHAAGCSCGALSIVSLHLFRSGASKNLSIALEKVTVARAYSLQTRESIARLQARASNSLHDHWLHSFRSCAQYNHDSQCHS